MVFTLELKGVKGEIPPGEFFLDWERTANDGKTETGRAPASLTEPLVIRTSLGCPGFRENRGEPSWTRWENASRSSTCGRSASSFRGGWRGGREAPGVAGAEGLRRALGGGAEESSTPCRSRCSNAPSCRPEPRPEALAHEAQRAEGLSAGHGLSGDPKTASAANKVKARGKLSGYYNFPERCPDWLTNHVDGIEMYINRHGCEVDREEEYYKQFFAPMPLPPDHFRGLMFRALQMFRFLKTLPEWNGRS
jgi:hypothetical protein